jgi:hypothetical protein
LVSRASLPVMKNPQNARAGAAGNAIDAPAHATPSARTHHREREPDRNWSMASLLG